MMSIDAGLGIYLDEIASSCFVTNALALSNMVETSRTCKIVL
jgi:hypothetical protein